MSNDFEVKFRSALERGKPLIETVIADLEREATLIRERDLDPRRLADEPKIKEARSSAVEALEHLTEFARSLDSLIKSYAADLDKRVDLDSIKEQLASASAAGRSKIGSSNGHDIADRIKSSGDDARERLESATQKGKEQVETATQKSREHVEAAAYKGKEHVEAATQKSKEQVEAAAQKGKDSTVEMLAALGWAAAAGAVIYVVFMDQKRREQTKKVAKAAGSGLMSVVNNSNKTN